MLPNTPATVPEKRTVLVCDDERVIVRLIQVNLERMGHKVITAFDGREALEKLRTNKPDLVLLDVMMPYVDGFEVLKSIRRNPETATLTVDHVDGEGPKRDDVDRGMEMGATYYMTKPFNPQDLARFLEQ